MLLLWLLLDEDLSLLLAGPGFLELAGPGFLELAGPGFELAGPGLPVEGGGKWASSETCSSFLPVLTLAGLM